MILFKQKLSHIFNSTFLFRYTKKYKRTNNYFYNPKKVILTFKKHKNGDIIR